MRHFDEMLEELLQKVVVMGSITEKMIELAMRSLIERNESSRPRAAWTRRKRSTRCRWRWTTRP